MLKREVLGIPTGMWLLSLLYLLVCILLRAYYVDYESLKQVSAVAEGIRRESLTFWSGHGPLGALLLWAVTFPLRFVFPLMESAQALGAVAITLTGLILYRLALRVGLSSAIAGWLAFVFYGSNVAWNGATMFPLPALVLWLTAWWAMRVIDWLSHPERLSARAVPIGLASVGLCLLNLFALVPSVVAGVLCLRRGGGVSYLGVLLAGVLAGYLAIYFAVLPDSVVVGGVERPKPSLIEWVFTGGVASATDFAPLSAGYWRATGEQFQNGLLALGRPFRVRDVYQYYLWGTFVTLLKGVFLLMVLITIIVLITIATGGERVLAGRWVNATRQLGGYTLLFSLLLLVLWQGDYQPMYLWTLFWALVGLAGWLGSYAPDDTQRVTYALAPLALVLVLFGLMKTSALRSPEYDSERQEAEAVYRGVQEGDTLVASTRLAEWLRYYTEGKALVIATEYWTQPDAEFQRLLERATRENHRVIVWEYALDPELYQHAGIPLKPEWKESLSKVYAKFQEGKGAAYLRRYANLVAYPTFTTWAGEVRTYGGKIQ